MRLAGVTEYNRWLFDHGELYAMVDELQNASIANTEEKTPITGANGTLIKNLKRNKAVTVTGTNGVVSLGLMSASTGDPVQEGADGSGEAVLFRISESIEIKTADEAQITYTAIGAVGNELKVAIKNADGSPGKRFEQDATASAGKFAFDPATKKITFDAGEVPVGTMIMVIYDRNVLGRKLVNSADNFSKTLDVYINAIAEDKCDNLYKIQVHIPRGDFSGNFTLAMGDVVTQDFEIQAMKSGSCAGKTDGEANLWEITVIDDDIADLPVVVPTP